MMTQIMTETLIETNVEAKSKSKAKAIEQIDQSDSGHTVGSHPIDAQGKLWEMLRNKQLNGFAFIRQVLVEPFIVDFACIELKFIVELDGGPHTEQQYYDRRRSEYLRNQGYLVVRFFNAEVLSSMAKVADTLRQAVEQRSKEVSM